MAKERVTINKTDGTSQEVTTSGPDESRGYEEQAFTEPDVVSVHVSETGE